MGRRICAEIVKPVQLSTEDAIRFLVSVKSQAEDKYEDFMAIMKEFKRGSVDIDDVISRVMVLFDGFNNFVPELLKIEIPDGDEADA